MRITKFGHACVRIEHDATVLVIDPGVFTDAEAVAGADAVLVTHEHPDHYHPDHLLAAEAPVFTIADVATRIRADAPAVAERLTVVAPGQSFDPGLPVRAVGELHNVIHPELPRPHNSGYLVTAGSETVYHPGDALTPPDERVDVLLCPSSAPWLRSEMAIDFVREVAAPRNLAIHDRVYSDVGHQFLAAQMEQLVGPRDQEWIRLADGADL